MKLKVIIVICMLLVVAGRSYSQDSLTQQKIHAIATDFSNNGVQVGSYNKLPKFIRSYLDRTIQSKFSISKKKFNATDAGGGPKRKLAYVVKLENDYLLGYEHGGLGYHFHSLIFQTNGKEVTGLFPLATVMKLSTISELIKIIEAGNYRFYRNDF